MKLYIDSSTRPIRVGRVQWFCSHEMHSLNEFLQFRISRTVREAWLDDHINDICDTISSTSTA